jgi:hypothetical protein
LKCRRQLGHLLQQTEEELRQTATSHGWNFDPLIAGSSDL